MEDNNQLVLKTTQKIMIELLMIMKEEDLQI